MLVWMCRKCGLVGLIPKPKGPDYDQIYAHHSSINRGCNGIVFQSSEYNFLFENGQPVLLFQTKPVQTDVGVEKSPNPR